MKQELEKFEEYLRSQGLKFTRTRKLIFEEILSTPEIHPNAYDIHQQLKKKGRRVSLATIYRTLNVLVKSGFVSQIDLGEDHSHYEPEIAKTGHGHLVCLSCGRVKEFSDGKIQKTINRIGKRSHFRMDKFSIQVFGFCRNCKR